MRNRTKGIFFRLGSFSHINDRVEACLSTWPDFQTEICRIEKLVDLSVPQNVLSACWNYGKNIMLRRYTWDDCLEKSPWYFEHVRRQTAQYCQQYQPSFTLQTQSFLDTSQPGIPHFIYTDHTHLANLQYPGFNRNRLFPETFLCRERTLYHNATIIFTMSNHISRSLIVDYDCPKEKVVCIGAGANAPLPTELARLDNHRILFVGIEWERKGGPELVSAFMKVKAKIPDAELIIVGCNPTISIPGCQVLGRVPVNEMSGLFQNAAVFCLPSWREPFGVVVVEAMSHGLPIVTSRIGAMPDLVKDGENGFLVEPGNIPSLTQAITTLLEDHPLRKRLGSASATTFCTGFTWDKVGTRLCSSISACMKPSIGLHQARN